MIFCNTFFKFFLLSKLYNEVSHLSIKVSHRIYFGQGRQESNDQQKVGHFEGDLVI